MRENIVFNTKHGPGTGEIEITTKSIEAHSLFSEDKRWDKLIKIVKKAINEEVSKLGD